jgi:hypothetical protein
MRPGLPFFVDSRTAALVAVLSLSTVAAWAATAAAPAAPPTAVIIDGSTTMPDGVPTLFVVSAVDSVDVRHALGVGPRLRFVRPGDPASVAPVEHEVPAGRVTLTLLGWRQPGPASAAEVMEPSRLFGVSGEVKLDLSAGKRYRVAGHVDAQRREVWVEDVDMSQIVGRKVVDSPNDSERTEAGAADRYACCNLHVADRWISDVNYAALQVVPAGARVRITGFGRNRVHVNIEGRPMSAGIDSETRRTREELAEGLFVKDDPRPRILAMPPDVQAAILSGRVQRGMTRDQVVLALGHPRADRTPSLEARRWVYSASERDEFDIDFDADGRVAALNAATRVRQAVWASP